MATPSILRSWMPVDTTLKLRERVDLHFINRGPVGNISPTLVQEHHHIAGSPSHWIYVSQARTNSGSREVRRLGKAMATQRRTPPPQLLGGWPRKANFRLGGAEHAPWFPPVLRFPRSCRVCSLAQEETRRPTHTSGPQDIPESRAWQA